MGPDSFVRRPTQPGQPQRPQMRPTQPSYNPNPQPLHSQQPQFRTGQPMDDFGMRPAAQARPAMQPRPAANYAQAVPQQPMKPKAPQYSQQQFRQYAQPPQPTTRTAQTKEDEEVVVSNPVDFSAHLKNQKKPRFSKKMKLAFACAILLAGVSFGAFTVLSKETDKQVVNAQPAHAPLVKPEFVVYFPNPLPDGLTTTKGSIMYQKDSFSFILQKDGENRIYVLEQNASTDPDLKTLKSKLTAPQALDFNIGKGLDGSLGTRTVTAVKTGENAIITITCSKIDCKTYSRLVIANMKMVDNIEGLRNSNL